MSDYGLLHDLKNLVILDIDIAQKQVIVDVSDWLLVRIVSLDFDTQRGHIEFLRCYFLEFPDSHVRIDIDLDEAGS